MICRRWRPVAAHIYGRARLVCIKPRDRYGHGAWHESHDGWSWKPGSSGPFGVMLAACGVDQPWRLWYCHGDAGRCRQKLIATFDQARARGWRIGWRDGQLDPLCDLCARPDPATVALCRDLERSVRR